ncbi:MAG: hypothetical protein JW947_07170 [Sedimentisphaerales bacterium]|nr:hypothetical protein [Sedimentisphaerales bacterium]
MSYWLAQLILAARDKSDDGWIQILVFVILAVFYAVGSIISKAKKSATNGKEQAPGKPVRKQPEVTIDLRMLKQLFGIPEEAESSIEPGLEESETQIAKPQVQPPGRKVIRPQPAMRKIPIETSKIKVMEPQVQPKLEKVSGLTGKSEVSTGIPQTKYLSDILSDYDDPEKLRMAILHYEILGKPISLREPSERIF